MPLSPGGARYGNFYVNTLKGKIGDKLYLLGMTAKLQVAAFQRADTDEEKRKDFSSTSTSFKTYDGTLRRFYKRVILQISTLPINIEQLPEDIAMRDW